MIILDTNVISELARPRPHQRVLDWAEGVARKGGAVASVTVAELLLGLRLMPHGTRRDELAARVTGFLGRLETLPFDRTAAEHFAGIVADRRSMGRPISLFDAQIAAIARASGASVATRDVRGFEGCGVRIVDPWATAGG